MEQEQRPLAVEYKSKWADSSGRYRHDVAVYRYGRGGELTADFTLPPTEAKIRELDDLSAFSDMRGTTYTKAELIAHIANLQTIADNLGDDEDTN